MRVKCNKFIDNYQFCDGDDIFDFGSESTLEIGDFWRPKNFHKIRRTAKESLSDEEKGMIKKMALKRFNIRWYII